jgi:D-alanyl-D-alanine carboxypeptidase (penicillin-binding protein 5/6)
MLPMRPPRTTTRPAPGRIRLVVSFVAAASVGVLLLGQAPVDSAPRTGAVTARQVTAVASTKVVLKRRKGVVQGDGRTRYVANGTEFRPRRTSVALPPRVRARSWVVVDLDTGRLLGKHRARARLPQASTIKLLTAMTATRTIAPRAKHRVTKFEKSQVCSCAPIRRGRWYRRDALIKAMLLPSANDAAEAVAGSHPQGRWAFYAEMNALAQELGAVDTVAKNASGLTATGSHSSARDLVLLLRASLQDPTVARVLGQRSARIATAANKLPRRVWRGTDYVNRYPGSLGKSGWTTPAQNTLVVVTEIDGHRIATAHLGAPSGYSTDGARALTEWASENFRGLNAVGRLPVA